MNGMLELGEATPLTAVRNRWSVVEFVHPDEPCYFMLEQDVMKADYTGLRRFRIFAVNRADKMCYFWQDLGPGTNKDAFQIISVWEDTVGEVIDLAEYMHANPQLYEGKRADLMGESTLIKDFGNQLEMAHKVLKHQTHSGPSLTIQR